MPKTIKTTVFVTYLFPPDRAVGGLRVGKFARGLAETYRWNVHVVRPRRESVATTAPLSDRIHVHDTCNWDIFASLARIRRLLRFRAPDSHDLSVRGVPRLRVGSNKLGENRKLGWAARISDHLAVPDSQSGWVYFAYRQARRCIHKYPQCVLFSSGPPHSAHVAAALAKWRTGCPWIADLRDPWADNPYFPDLTPSAIRWNHYLESWALGHADVIICNTTQASASLEARLPGLSPTSIVTIPNGFDAEDYSDIKAQPLWPVSAYPVLLHSGFVYGQRDPSIFLDAFAKWHAHQRDLPFRVVFLGDWAPELRTRTEEFVTLRGLADAVLFHDTVTRSESLNAMAAADGLLLLGDPTPNSVQVPAKVFEYLRMRKPILSLFPIGSPVDAYLSDYACAYSRAAPNSTDEIVAALSRLRSTLGDAVTPLRDIDELDRTRHISTLDGLMTRCLWQRDRIGRMGTMLRNTSME